MAKGWDVGKLTPTRRLEMAREKARALIDHVTGLIALHESNRLILYSDILSRQIPKSRAAHAFNLFRRTMHHFEVVRLCAIWDKPSPDRESVPSLLALVDHPDVIELIRSEIASQWGEVLIEGVDGELEGHIRKSERDFGGEQADRIIAGLHEAIVSGREISASDKLAALIDFRDKHLAHSLAETVIGRKGVALPAPKHGDEREILELSIEIAHKTYLGVCGTDFDFSSTRGLSKGHAESLWSACKFDVIS